MQDHFSYPQNDLQSIDALFSMLNAQAEAVWPQEREILLKHFENSRSISLNILDIGCGCGEACFRMSQLFPKADIVGIDLSEQNIQFCKDRLQRLSSMTRSSESLACMRFQVGNAYELSKHFACKSFDLITCRSVLHAIYRPELVLGEMIKIAKPGGIIHMLNEDYGMIFSHPVSSGVRKLWDATVQFFSETGSNGLLGRASFSMVKEYEKNLASPLKNIEVNFIFADTMHVARETIAKIFSSWKDGYCKITAEHSSLSEQECKQYYDEIIRCIESESGYVCWQLVLCTVTV